MGVVLQVHFFKPLGHMIFRLRNSGYVARNTTKSKLFVGKLGLMTSITITRWLRTEAGIYTSVFKAQISIWTPYKYLDY